MNFKETFAAQAPVISFELFPPKSADGLEALLVAVDELQQYEPHFYTCTYGAGGSTQTMTLQIARAVRERTGLPVASHLTCVGSTVDQLRDYLRTAGEAGVESIVALRGDPPKGETAFRQTEGGLRYANELVALIRSEFPHMDVAVAGYPEVHQEATDRSSDLLNLKRKVDAGASVIITQLFYQNDDYFEFVDDCRQIGIDVPIVPGIMPITNLKQIQRITQLCKAALPESLVQRLGEKENTDWQFNVGVEFATSQIRDLLAAGVPGVHFYVLNRSQATGRVLSNLDLQPSL